MLTLISRPMTGGGDTTTTPVETARAPSRLLVHLAGDFAGQIACVWPAPHTPFVLAETARRHLACLALARAAQDAVMPGPGFVARALEGSLKRALADLVSDAPPGLLRALQRLGETAWTVADYQRLLSLLTEPAAAKVLRHAAAITPADVAVLSALPPMLAQAGGLLLRLTEDQCRLAAYCHAGILRRDGPARARHVAQRWAAAKTARVLFNFVQDDIGIEAAEPFHPGTERLRPLPTRTAVLDASRRYRNCLDGREPSPSSHYYEWLGPPGAIIQICRDGLWGWSVEEGRLAGNEPLPADLRAALTADLAVMGVHVGARRRRLHWLLPKATRPGFTFGDPEYWSVEAFEG